MSVGSTTKRTAHFPYQKKSTAAKKKPFVIDCIESSLDLSYNGDTDLLQTKKDIQINSDEQRA